MAHLAHLGLGSALGVRVCKDEREGLVLVRDCRGVEWDEFEDWARGDGGDWNVVAELDDFVGCWVGDGGVVGGGEFIEDFGNNVGAEEDVSDW